MNQTILLDSGPIGLVTNPKLSTEGVACANWLQSMISTGHRIIIPEIIDYEIRRELIRANRLNGLRRLEQLITLGEYLPITTAAMRQAALLWAQARQQGQPTAGDKTIDADVILASQAMTLAISDVVIATTNVGHLSRFVQADLWQNIR